MKPTRLHPLRPSRRLFTVPACPRLRRLTRWSERVRDVAYAVVCVGCCVLIGRYLAMGFVPA